MKQKIKLFLLLTLFFSSFITVMFWGVIKQINFKALLQNHSVERNELCVNTWVENKEKREQLHQNYQNSSDSQSLKELKTLRELFVENFHLNIFNNGHYIQKTKGSFATIETKGDWHNEGNYLVLNETTKINSLDIVSNNQPRLFNVYYKVIALSPDEMTLMLDYEKTNLPKELGINADTIFLKKSE